MWPVAEPAISNSFKRVKGRQPHDPSRPVLEDSMMLRRTPLGANVDDETDTPLPDPLLDEHTLASHPEARYKRSHQLPQVPAIDTHYLDPHVPFLLDPPARQRAYTPPPTDQHQKPSSPPRSYLCEPPRPSQDASKQPRTCKQPKDKRRMYDSMCL